jgi:hypothetical protein
VNEPADVDALYAELLAAGEVPARVADVLGRPIDEETMLAVLRRAVPVKALEHLARTKPWTDRARVLAAIVLNPKAPPRLSLPLVPALLWRSLAEVAASARVPSAVRLRAEATLKDALPQLRLGEKITLGRLATPSVLLALLSDPDARVLTACLENPRLREADLVMVLRRPDVSVALMEATTTITRWQKAYAVKLELALQPRAPLHVALAQLSSLLKRDLIRVAGTAGLAPLVQRAAERVAGER